MSKLHLLTKYKHFRAVAVGVFFAVIIGSAISVMAYEDGITGLTSDDSNGCYCHTNTSSSNTSVSINGSSDDFTVAPNSSNDYSITVTNNESSISHAGVNIAVKSTESGSSNAGTLSVSSGSDLQVSSGEVTHTEPHQLSSGSTTFNFSWDAPSNPGTYYIRAISNAVNNNGSNDNGDMWNRMSVKQVTVYGLTVESPSSGDAFCPGGSTNITWSATGADNVKIELSSNGGSTYDQVLNSSVAASAESWTWNIPSDLAAGSQYRIKITDTGNSDITDEMDGNFEISEATQITAQPQGTDVCSGENVTFEVTASGGNLSYQWKKDGSDLSGQTSASLTITGVETSDAGNYTCVVSGACGDPVTSDAATLTVTKSPEIVTHPEGGNVCAGGGDTLSVEAEGAGLQYQWKKDGSDLAGETGAALILSNIQTSDAGSYTVVVTGECPGEVTSNQAILVVNEEISITSQPQDMDLCEGETATFTVSADGGNPDYQWYKADQMIDGETTASLEITEVSSDDAGDYHVEITGPCNSVESNMASLTVDPLPSITASPQSRTVTEGDQVTFSVTAEGGVTVYRWRKDGAELSGETSSELVISSATMEAAGSYDVIAVNECGADTSEVADLTVEAAGPGPVLSLSQSNVDFGMLIMNNQSELQQEITLSNSGNEALMLTNISLGGSDAAEFGLDLSLLDLPLSLDAEGETTFSVIFSPSTAGEKMAEVTFESNANNNTVLALTGFAANIDVAADQSTYDFGEKEETGPVTLTVLLQNQSNVDVEINGLSSSGDVSAFSLTEANLPESIATNGESRITVDFTAEDNGTYQAEYEIDYQYLDEPLTFTLSGEVNISSVASIYDQGEIKIYPNPGTSNFRISVNTGGEYINELELKLIDYSGKVLKEFKNVNAGGTAIEIDWDGRDSRGNVLSNGTYYLMMRVNGMQETLPVVLER